MTRATALLTGALGVALAASASAQSIAERVARAPDGTVRLAYAAREGVCGNGAGVISFDSANGTCGRRRINTDSDWDDGPCPCDSGPVRLALRVASGRVTRLRAYVGGRWREGIASVTDLGTVGAAEAARYLLALARSNDSQAGEEAIFPATLADSITVWPELVRLARDNSVRGHVRNQAVFWLAEAAGDAAVKDLADMVGDDSLDRDVREHAVFALSQEPHDVGVPALIQIARTNRDREVRKKAFFWLGQTHDPRALALFEEVLTKP